MSHPFFETLQKIYNFILFPAVLKFMILRGVQIYCGSSHTLIGWGHRTLGT